MLRKIWLRRNILLVVAALSLQDVVHAQSTSTTNPDALQWKFRVYLDDKEIGYHNYTITDLGDERKVETQARFDVKVLFFNAYRYRHQNTERWRNNCLTDINASTNANGDEFEVSGEKTDNRFKVETGSGTNALPSCVMSFAYWNPAILEASKLLNAQTGQYQSVDVRPNGSTTIDVDGTAVAANRYDLVLEKGTISVWYAADDQRWLALDAPAKGDRRIRYQPIAVPSSPVRLSNNSPEMATAGS